MHVITRIEMIDVPRDVWEIGRTISPYFYPVSSDNTKPCDTVEFSTELIRGRRFVRNGHEYVIGNHSGVEDLLNIQLECLDNYSRDVDLSYNKGLVKGKNIIWDKIKDYNNWFRKDTNYWWMPPIIFLIIGVILA